MGTTVTTPPASGREEARKNQRSRLANAGKVLRFAARRAGEKKLTQVASSLTFTTVLAIVPLLAVVLALFTAFPLFGEFRLALEDFLTSNLMPPAVSENVMTYLNQFAASASKLTAVGSVFLVVTSIMLMMTIDEAFNDIWHVRQQRPLRQRMLVYWMILSLGPILVGASLWATSLMASISLGRFAQVSTTVSFALSLIPLTITGLGFALLFVHVPNRQVYWRDALAGGFGAAIVLAIMKAGFTLYLTRFPSYRVIYGTFATIPIFLLWIYLSWLAILFGATVAATLPLLRLRRWAENRQPGTTFLDAIAIIRILHATRQRLPAGRSTRFLGSHLELYYDELLTALQALQELGYVVRVQGKGDDRWALACELRETGLGPVIDALLIDRWQPRLRDDPTLAGAVAAELTRDGSVRLDEILHPGQTAPENATSDCVRNAIRNAPTSAK